MKKIITAALLCIFAALPTMAETHKNASTSTFVPHYGTDIPRASLDYLDEKYIGFRIGPAFTSAGSDDKELNASGVKTGLNLGVAVGFPLSDSTPLFLESGLYYIEKGGKNDDVLKEVDGKNQKCEEKYSLNYLELPVVLKYKYDVNEDFSVQPLLGAYVACGVGGKIKNYTLKEQSASFKGNGFKRFDAGLKLGVGGQYDLFYAEIAYDLGLANINNRSDFDTSHNSAFTISVGINF